MDWLNKRRDGIEKNIYEKRSVLASYFFLYDITSVYFEGEKCEFLEYGYNRDGKRNKKQIVIGLVVDSEGFPLSCEVFSGNTQDSSTLVPKIERLKRRYNIKEATIIGEEF